MEIGHGDDGSTGSSKGNSCGMPNSILPCGPSDENVSPLKVVMERRDIVVRRGVDLVGEVATGRHGGVENEPGL